MCGRVAQFGTFREIVELLRWPGPAEERQQADARYNIPPSTLVKLLHAEGDTLIQDLVRWGWRPHWATDNRLPSNARVEKVAHSSYWRAIWPHRAVAPIEGWFEWVKDQDDPKKKLPFFIRRADGLPCLAAAIGQFPTGDQEQREHDGCAIITDEAAGGLVDVHDRRPVILPAELVAEWLDPATRTERAEQLLLQQSEPPETFEWYRVSTEVNSSAHKGAQLITSIER
ncbi:SOS response-associated peptidase [Pseudomonas sp. NPDC086581]|uniref:SOS response-associated peptidase n=1 Tax=Pseudomonas sp. NPDC086581 TaxID=3364432 RepID=UPI0038088ACB